MPEIYQPSEDSYLMSEILKREIPNILKKNPDLRFLEIGCGSGINLETAKSIGLRNIMGTDINPSAIDRCKSLGFEVIMSDLFSNVKGFFDVIIFNPPYLPFDKRESLESRTATTGGKKGNELIVKFLKQAKSHLSKEGRMFLITSSISGRIDFEKFGYESNRIGSKKLFFEELILWEIIVK